MHIILTSMMVDGQARAQIFYTEILGFVKLAVSVRQASNVNEKIKKV
jgi:catechol 2,3-dioxygenase-like lactoylglutathione lyase family enzyme